MVQDNPYLKVWRSLFLDQTELNIFGKYSSLNQIWENDPHPIDWHCNLNLTNGIIYIFEPLWSLMTKGEK